MRETLCVLCFLGMALSGVPAQELTIPGFPQQHERTVPEKVYNYTTLTAKQHTPSAKWLAYNKEFRTHPDAGYVAMDQPDSLAIEILEKRTESTRFYVHAQDPGRVYSQGAYGPLHYRKNNQWLLIDRRLSAVSPDIAEASRQPEPVGFDFRKRKSYIRTVRGAVYFNDWKLYGVRKGKKQELAQADWSDHTVGDDGVYVKNMFPGVDGEMMVLQGRIKTNLIIHSWQFPAYDSIILEDTYSHGQAVVLKFREAAGTAPQIDELDLTVDGNLIAQVGKAMIYSEADPAAAQLVPYTLAENRSGIVLDGPLLRELLSRGGKVIVDPLVRGAESVLGEHHYPLDSYNNANCSYDDNPGCSYTWPVPVPAAVTITNIHLWVYITTFAPCTRDKMRFLYAIGNNSCGSAVRWSTMGNPATPGGTGGDRYYESDIYNDCIPAACTQTSIDFRLTILRSCMGPAGCEATCVEGTGPFSMTIEGRSLELMQANALPATPLCQGEEATLKAAADFGIGPYTYSWNPGNSSEEEIQVRPDKTTDYTVKVADVCGNTAEAIVPVTVVPIPATPTVQIENSTAGEACENSPLTFRSKVEEGDTIGYQWKVNGNAVPGATAADFTTNALEDGDVVQLDLTNLASCADPERISSNTLTVALKKLTIPSVTLASVPAVCEGDAVTFTGLATGEGNSPVFQWEKNGVPVGTDLASYTATDLQDGDTVQVLLRSSEVCVTVPEVVSNEVRVTVHSPETVTVTEHICPGMLPFTWNGNTLNTGGMRVASWTMPSAKTGCDSTTILNLVVAAAPLSREFEISGCGVLDYNGKRYTSNTVVTETLQNANGCDSLFNTVTLTVFPQDVQQQTLSLSGCDSVVYEGQTYYATVMLDDTFKTYLGCDSLHRRVQISVVHFSLELESDLPPELYVGDKIELRAVGNIPGFRITGWEPDELFPDRANGRQQVRVSDSTTYVVYAETPEGCRDSASIFIPVLEQPKGPIYPMVFTPNGDQVNDVWTPVKQVDRLEVRVYNRWGECVYESTDPLHAWDGFYKGQRIPAGTYSYRVKVNDRFYFEGSVMVVY